MQDFSQAANKALSLILTLNPELLSILWLSAKVSGVAVILACCAALPIGAWIGMAQFRGKGGIVAVLNGLMGMPSVVLGLVVYLLLSRAGPFGAMGLLFTPTAMMIAQALLIFPIVAALTLQRIGEAWDEHADQLRSLRASRWQCVRTLLWDNRFSLVTFVLLCFGRAIAEVGAVMIVGGNIDGVTRVMTTAIALETSKGDIPLSLALGAVLIASVISVNAAAQILKNYAQRRYG
jgi:tungstate transport system permease protein